jgi:hypothetical protein
MLSAAQASPFTKSIVVKMEYITSRHRKLPIAGKELADDVWFNLWKSRLWPYEQLMVGDVLYWYETKSQALVWKSTVVKIERFAYEKKSEVIEKLQKLSRAIVSNDYYFREGAESGFCFAYKVSPLQRLNIPKPKAFKFPQSGWLRIDAEVRAKWLSVHDMTPDSPALTLNLHSRYGRSDAFKSVGLNYTSQDRHLNTGLSPRCPDGGYFIFITLDKTDFDNRHDYDDQLFQDRLIWVTRRGRDEAHPDYVNIRNANTRVSLFVRHDQGEDFIYAGELEYQSHRQFNDPSSNEIQQSYTLRLKSPLPEKLLEDLSFGVVRRKAVSSDGQRTRRPSTFDEYKKAFSYVIGTPDRTVIPAHHNYQVRLRQFLRMKGIGPIFEKDFVDVKFSLEDTLFIGEIKVSTIFGGVNQAYRAALGQLIEYSRLRFKNPPQMVMFLDAHPDSKRVQLARDLAIAIVVETEGKYQLLNPDAVPLLHSLFPIRS